MMLFVIQDPVGYHIDCAIAIVCVTGLIAFGAWLFYKNETKGRR